jgi:hypothetical protein
MPVAVNHDTGEVQYLGDDGQWAPAKRAVNPQTKQMMAYDGKSWVDVPAKSRGVLGYIDDAVRSLASGATFGFADKIAAKGDELLGKGKYEENLAAERARDEQIPAAIKYPGEIAGAVGGMVAAAPVTAPLKAISGIARLPGYVRAIGGGAAAGAAYGAGESKPGEELKGAAEGAPFGVVAGAVVPPLVAGGSRLFSELRGAVSPQANVSADLSRALARDKMTPEELFLKTQEAQKLRPGVATPADVGGENVRGLVERIAQTPGAGRTQVVPALTERQRGQMARISTDLRSLTGARQTATQAISETMEQRAQDAKPLYDIAFDFNARAKPEIVKAWNEVTSTGWGRSILMRPDFRRTLQTEYGISDPTNAPLMVVIDAWKKAADDMIGKAIKSGEGNQARVLSGMRDWILSVVDEHNPAYPQARGAWSGPSRYLDAIDEGRNIFKTNIGSDEVASGVAAMKPADREGYVIGAVSAILGKMGNDPAKFADMTKYLRSPEMRKKVAALMPDEKARHQWQQRLDFEVSSSELTRQGLGGSPTARRQAEQADQDGIVGDLVMDVFRGRPPVGLMEKAVGLVSRKTRDTLRSRSDDILAHLLTDPQTMQGLRDAIRRVESKGPPAPIYPRSGAVRGAIAATTDAASGLLDQAPQAAGNR